MTLTDHLHGRFVAGRRARRLANLLAALIPRNARVLDVGCGDGTIASLVASQREDIEIHGLDVLVREDAWLPITPFDGLRIPYAENSVDCIMLVDVLHHTEDPLILLREASRVARQAVVLKDHLREGALAGQTLRFMDRVGNKRFGVALPYNYWRRSEWTEAIKQLGMEVDHWQERLKLYPWPARAVFDRHLHFIARLSLQSATAGKIAEPVAR